MNAEGAKKLTLKKVDRPSATPAAPPPSAVRLTGRVEEWRADRGFGFLRFEEHRIFVHRRDFAAFHRVPAVGDAVEFVLGADRQGRICALQAELAHDGGRIRRENLVVLSVLLIAPVAALLRFFGIEYWYATLGIALLPSLLAYLLYADDHQMLTAYPPTVMGELGLPCADSPLPILSQHELDRIADRRHAVKRREVAAVDKNPVFLEAQKTKPAVGPPFLYPPVSLTAGGGGAAGAAEGRSAFFSINFFAPSAFIAPIPG